MEPMEGGGGAGLLVLDVQFLEICEDFVFRPFVRVPYGCGFGVSVCLRQSSGQP